ncbi:response regulator, partial [candidate division GN15 bacterium]|nr:response regulator [candidate division GN15 bacterium]
MSEVKGRILVVDDDPTLLNLLVDTLTSIGYESVAATDGIEAVEILQSEGQSPFDLMITDVKMPKMDGVGLLRRVRRVYPDMPVVFITGVAGPEIIAEASPDGYLSKPFRIGHLEDLIQRTLAQKDPAQFNSTPHPRRVLIDVTRENARLSLAEALSATNYLAFTVDDSEQALRELENGTFDAIITDLPQKPTESRAAVRKIRRSNPKLKLIGFGERTEKAPAPRERSASPGFSFDAWIESPLPSRDLVRLLDET